MTNFAGLPRAVGEALQDEPVPDWRAPALATLTEDRFSDPHWSFERKFDGMRCLTFRDGDRLRLLSRNRKPLNGTIRSWSMRSRPSAPPDSWWTARSPRSDVVLVS